MAQVTITIADTPNGGVSVQSDYTPAIGEPCTSAQSTALAIISRTKREWGISTPNKPMAQEVDIDAVHRRRDGVVNL